MSMAGILARFAALGNPTSNQKIIKWSAENKIFHLIQHCGLGALPVCEVRMRFLELMLGTNLLCLIVPFKLRYSAPMESL